MPICCSVRRSLQLTIASVLLLTVGSPRLHAQNAQPGEQPKKLGGFETITTSPEFSLRPRWTRDDVQHYVFTIDHEQTAGPQAPATGETSVTGTRQEVHLTRKVINTGDEGVVLAITYQRVKVRISVGEDAVEIDTANPKDQDADQTLGEIARSVIGKTINLTLSQDGRVLGIEGNQITRGNEPSAQSLVGAAVFREQLAPMWGLPEAPEKARAGRSWGHNARLPMGHLGTLLTEARYTILEPSSDDTGAPESIATIQLAGPSRVVAAVGPSARPVEHRDGATSGTVRWNATAGRLESYDATRTLSYALTSEQSPTVIQTTTKTQIVRSPGPAKP